MYLISQQYERAIQSDIERNLELEQMHREREEDFLNDAQPARRQSLSWDFINGFLALFTNSLLRG
jgi:hypothetical protein